MLIYTLPFLGVQGDVLIADVFFTFGDACNFAVCDVVRFNGDGTLIFYSDNIDGFDAPADTTGKPATLYANQKTCFDFFVCGEFGPEGNNRSIYTAAASEPGFNAAFAPTFIFISDVPEPGTWLLILGGGALLLVRRFMCVPRGSGTGCAPVQNAGVKRYACPFAPAAMIWPESFMPLAEYRVVPMSFTSSVLRLVKTPSA